MASAGKKNQARPILGCSEPNLYLEEAEGRSTSARALPRWAPGSGAALLAPVWPWGEPSRSQRSSGERGLGHS